jgi:hypothetical protein
LVAIGAVVVVIAWVVGLLTPFGIGSNTVALVAALAALVVLYLKYSPTSNVNWPAPVPVILLGIGIVAGLFALFGLTGLYIGGLYLLAALATIVGAALMAWGSFQEWQASQKTA